MIVKHGGNCDCCPPYGEDRIIRKGERIVGDNKEISVSIDSILTKGEFVITDKAYELLKQGNKK